MKRLSLLWRRFTPLEEFLLAVLQQKLPEEARRINQRRIDRINRVCRPLEWTEIMFYHMRWGRVIKHEEEMFSCRSREEIVLAEITFSPLESQKIWKSKIYAVSGTMFSIVTRPSPKRIAFADGYTLKSVKLIDDPMVTHSSSIQQRYQNRLPSDYDDFKGQLVSGWLVFETADIYTVSLQDADYLRVAEKEDESTVFLGVKVEGETKDVYLIPHDDESVRLASTLREAIEKRS